MTNGQGIIWPMEMKKWEVNLPYNEGSMQNVGTSVKEVFSEEQVRRSIESCVLLSRKRENLKFRAAAHPRRRFLEMYPFKLL